MIHILRFCFCILFLVSCSSSSLEYRSENVEWEPVNVPKSPFGEYDHYNIEGIENQIWITTKEANHIIHFDGKSWNREKLDPRGSGIRGMDVTVVSPTDIWLGGGDGYFARYNGDQWLVGQVPNRVTNGRYDFFNLKSGGVFKDQYISLVNGKGFYAKWTDSEEWQKVLYPSNKIIYMHGFWTDGTVLAMGYREKVGIGVAVGDGDVYTKHALPVRGYVSDMDAVTINDLWVVGVQKPMFGKTGMVSRFDGKNFKDYSKSFPVPVNGVSVHSKDLAVVVGQNGFAAVWDGKEWKRSRTGSTGNLFDVYITPVKEVYAVGLQGVVIKMKTKL